MQFLRLLAPPLTAVGLNQAAGKSLTKGLEDVAAALEPFANMTTDQLTEFLKLAETYRRDGKIPESALGKKSRAASGGKPKTSKPTPEEAVGILRDLKQRALHMEPSQVAQEVQALAPLTTKDLQIVQREFLGAVVGKKKDEMLAALQKRIDDFRSTSDRIEGIRTY